MKKLFAGIGLLGLSLLTLTSCGGKDCDLLILNWGDYISSDVVRGFEEKYNVKVELSIAESNELMLNKIRNRQAEYDIAVPSDYMIDQMKNEKLIKKLDFTKIESYNENLFVPELVTLMNSEACNNYKDYYVPYFWGSLGIMYNKRTEGVEEAVKTNGWATLFDETKAPAGVKIGMYDVSRDAIAAAELYKGYSLNTKDKNKIDECMQLLKNNNSRYEWGTDELKKKIAKGNLDIALVYSGDFFDAYYSDQEVDEANLENYGIYAPTTANNVFFDSLVIPETCTNEDLAYKFISYMLEYENSYNNADFVGYCPTVNAVYENIKASDDWSDVVAIDAYHPDYIVKNGNGEVYAYLEEDAYEYLEEEFNKVRIG